MSLTESEPTLFFYFIWLNLIVCGENEMELNEILIDFQSWGQGLEQRAS